LFCVRVTSTYRELTGGAEYHKRYCQRVNMLVVCLFGTNVLLIDSYERRSA